VVGLEKNVFVGIDPGVSGGIAVMHGWTIDIIDMPVFEVRKGKRKKKEYDIRAIVDFFNQFGNICQFSVAIEKTQPLPRGKSIQATYGLSRCQGIFEGVLTALGISYEVVHSKDWHKHFRITKAKGDYKDQAVLLAEKLFPTAELRGPRGGKKDGRADSLLIAEFIRRKNRGEVE
jgi:hypothetical protein